MIWYINEFLYKTCLEWFFLCTISWFVNPTFFFGLVNSQGWKHWSDVTSNDSVCTGPKLKWLFLLLLWKRNVKILLDHFEELFYFCFILLEIKIQCISRLINLFFFFFLTWSCLINLLLNETSMLDLSDKPEWVNPESHLLHNFGIFVPHNVKSDYKIFVI